MDNEALLSDNFADGLEHDGQEIDDSLIWNDNYNDMRILKDRRDPVLEKLSNQWSKAIMIQAILLTLSFLSRITSMRNQSTSVLVGCSSTINNLTTSTLPFYACIACNGNTGTISHSIGTTENWILGSVSFVLSVMVLVFWASIVRVNRVARILLQYKIFLKKYPTKLDKTYFMSLIVICAFMSWFPLIVSERSKVGLQKTGLTCPSNLVMFSKGLNVSINENYNIMKERNEFYKDNVSIDDFIQLHRVNDVHLVNVLAEKYQSVELPAHIYPEFETIRVEWFSQLWQGFLYFLLFLLGILFQYGSFNSQYSYIDFKDLVYSSSDVSNLQFLRYSDFLYVFRRYSKNHITVSHKRLLTEAQHLRAILDNLDKYLVDDWQSFDADNAVVELQ